MLLCQVMRVCEQAHFISHVCLSLIPSSSLHSFLIASMALLEGEARIKERKWGRIDQSRKWNSPIVSPYLVSLQWLWAVWGAADVGGVWPGARQPLDGTDEGAAETAHKLSALQQHSQAISLRPRRGIHVGTHLPSRLQALVLPAQRWREWEFNKWTKTLARLVKVDARTWKGLIWFYRWYQKNCFNWVNVIPDRVFRAVFTGLQIENILHQFYSDLTMLTF